MHKPRRGWQSVMHVKLGFQNPLNMGDMIKNPRGNVDFKIKSSWERIPAVHLPCQNSLKILRWVSPTRVTWNIIAFFLTWPWVLGVWRWNTHKHVQSDVRWNQRCLRTHGDGDGHLPLPDSDAGSRGTLDGPKADEQEGIPVGEDHRVWFWRKPWRDHEDAWNEFAPPVALDPQVMCLDYLWWSNSSRPVMRQLRNWFLRSELPWNLVCIHHVQVDFILKI